MYAASATSAGSTTTLLPQGRLDDVLHALRRTTFGPSRADVREVQEHGWRAWVDRQLDPESIPDPNGDRIRSWYTMLDWSSAHVIEEVKAGRFGNGDWDVMSQVVRNTLARQIWSSRQLFEMMTDFWSNHLNVPCPSSGVWNSRQVYDKHVIRRNALGKFPDMLVASMKSQAMSIYLNNATSTRENPNENYARELHELHTTGVGPYTEDDIQAAARLLTGWKNPWPERVLVFDPALHDSSAQKIMGFNVPAHDPAAGPLWQERYVRWLSMRPETASLVANKLCIRFVSDEPPSSLIDRVAAVYLSTGGSVIPMLREILLSPEFWQAKHQKIRKPAEDVIATIRALEIPLAPSATEVTHLYWLLSPTGNRPLEWSLPNGFPDVASGWQSAGAQVCLWTSHAQLVHGWWPKNLQNPDVKARLTSPLPATYADMIDRVARELVHQPLPTAERDAIISYMGKRPTDPVSDRDAYVRWWAGRTYTMVLDTPTFRRR